MKKLLLIALLSFLFVAVVGKSGFSASVYEGVWQVDQRMCITDAEDNKICMENYQTMIALNGDILEGFGNLIESGKKVGIWYHEHTVNSFFDIFLAENEIECRVIRSNVDTMGKFNKAKTKGNGKIYGNIFLDCGDTFKLLKVTGKFKLTYLGVEPTPEPTPE